MKTMLAALAVSIGLLSAGLPAQAGTGVYDGYPQWAADAFSRSDR